VSTRELTDSARPILRRGQPCVILALAGGIEPVSASLASVFAHTAGDVPVVVLLEPGGDEERLLSSPPTASAPLRELWIVRADRVTDGEGDPLTATLNRTLALVSPGDVVVLSSPCLLTAGWLERLRDAARGDTNIATASALTDRSGALSLAGPADASDGGNGDIDALATGVSEHTLRLHPRIGRAAGPCVYVRREALELVGPLDDRLKPSSAIDVDLAQRCRLSGLCNIAADDVLVGRVGSPPPQEQPDADLLRERYPYLQSRPEESGSPVLARALVAARGPDPRLWTTIDARALDGAITGTQVHILELIRALAATGALRLRVIVRADVIDGATRALLEGLPGTDVLAADDIGEQTPRSAVFHRPQQAFSAGDVELALRLGERVVISQLDLIAYSNPGYFPDRETWLDYRRASRHGMSAAERVVVFSDHTRSELLADALVEPERIRIVAPGLDHRTSVAPVRPGALSGETPFLLCLGTDFRHKNRLFALRLLDRLRERHGWEGRLVLAGSHIPFGSSLELERELLNERPELRPHVLELGAVDEAEKAWLIANAEAIAYPSVYEGFGLVPFESALSGVPCLFAAQASLAQVAPSGTAALIPWDVTQSAENVSALLGDSTLRERHIHALAHAARSLTWSAAATTLVEIYREAVIAPVRPAATLSRDATDRERRIDAVHEITVQKLEGERDRVQRSYEALIEEVGPGRSLVGPRGAMPDDLQRGMLALSHRPAVARVVFGVLGGLFAAVRALDRLTLRRMRRGR
jgi:glycosyltransferase involved in cell wall biosynthesis